MGMPYSRMRSSAKLKMRLPKMKRLSLLPSPARAMVGSPAGTRKLNKTDINHTLPDGRVRRLQKPLSTLVKICWCGSPLVGAANPVVGAREVKPVAVPEAPKTNHSTNDNYCVMDPVPVTQSLNVVPSATKNNKNVIAQTNVTCSVVSHAHFATKSLKQPQKKGLSPPVRNKVEINFVKCVSFVDHCFSVRTVPNVPNVEHAQLVGGRLQNFLADLGPPRRVSKGSFNFKERLSASIQNQTSTSKRPFHSQQVCKPH